MSDWIDQLERLTRLHQSGALTDAEFEAEKARLLAREPQGNDFDAHDGPEPRKSRLPLLAGAAALAKLRGFHPKGIVPQGYQNLNQYRQFETNGPPGNHSHLQRSRPGSTPNPPAW